MPTNGKINAIQGLRGIAALLVVIDHSILRFTEKTKAELLSDNHLTYVAETLGRHGVEIFFLISGFVMTIASYDDFRKPHATLSFLWRRIIRIVPLYWFVTALVIVGLLWHGKSPGAVEIVKSLGFIPYENETGLFQPLLRRGWTLNYEMFFYALFALALFQTPRRGLIAVIGVLLVLTLIGPHLVPADCADQSCDWPSFYVQPIMLYFAGGILLGALRVFLQRRGRMPSLRIDNGLGLAIVLTAGYAVYASLAVPSVVSYVVGVVFCILTVAFCALLRDQSEHGRLRALFVLVGEASYSIYMTHSIFIDSASHAWIQAFGRRWLAAYIVAMIIGTCLLGMVTFRLVEKPSLRLLRHGWSRKPPRLA
jgi:exopolysaccharide production protein ExoZ